MGGSGKVRGRVSAKRRYQIAFFALGWLIAVGVLFQIGFGSGFQAFYRSIAESLTRVAQRFSDAQGDALQQVRRGSRREYLDPLRPILDSKEALKNPPRVLFGAYDGGFPNTFAGLEAFEKDVSYRFPIISFYSAWGDKPTQQFPVRMVETIGRMGSVPMITWEPWVTDFDERLRRNLPRLAEREYASLSSIAKGDYDFYIVPWAKAAADYKKPIFLRFAHEMNDPYRYPWGPQNGNRPDDFIAAWRRVHDIFQKKGATNVIWVWSPHISMPWFEYYYPGDHVVDWVGMGILNYGTVASWSRWWSLHQILDKAYPTLAKFNKPMMIAELGTLAQGGDILVWYQQAFYQLEHTYGRVRSIIFFNQPNDVTMSNYPLNWTVGQDPRAAEFVAKELARLSAQ